MDSYNNKPIRSVSPPNDANLEEAVVDVHILTCCKAILVASLKITSLNVFFSKKKLAGKKKFIRQELKKKLQELLY